MAPMTTWAGDSDGHLTQDEFDYYGARSNGVGMVITGTTFMTANGKGFAGQYFSGSDACLPQLTRLADTIKAGGARAVLQIFHAGRNSMHALTQGHDVISASDIAAPREEAVIPRPMTEAEITEVIDSFARVTGRAIAAGFDGVEIHGANTYLIQQFFSPHANRREDAWGGSLEKRSRFPLAIVSAVLAAAKTRPGFVVGYRLSPEEVEQPGISLDDTAYLIDRLAGTSIDYLHLSLTHYAMTSVRNRSDTRVIGRLVVEQLDGRIPLIGVGQVHSEADLNSAFALGYNLVAVGKALVYDPQWFEKIVRGDHPVGALSETNRQRFHVPQRMYDVLFARRQLMGVCFE
jgi:2,4-dienoyl-CoA reductase-like NADH-dependent reductase (Old Yellow Enzyme family)